MKNWSACIALSVLCVGVDFPLSAEETTPPQPLSFSLSPSGLAPMQAEPPALATNAPTPAVDEELELSLHSISQDYTFESSVQQYEGINGSPALVAAPPKQELDGAAGWAQAKFEQALSLEVVRVRKVALSGSIITAMKRKNPLYLLNPLVFVASW